MHLKSAGKSSKQNPRKQKQREMKTGKEKVPTWEIRNRWGFLFPWFFEFSVGEGVLELGVFIGRERDRRWLRMAFGSVRCQPLDCWRACIQYSSGVGGLEKRGGPTSNH